MEQPQALELRAAQMELLAAPYPYSKMCELCELCELFVKKFHRFCDGIFFIYPQQNLFVFSGTPEISDFWGEEEWRSAYFDYRNPLAKSLLTIGIFRRSLMSRVVRLLERAEEGCEGLKHGYYDLPCVYFLIFLCHDIKNKIDRLVFNKEQN